MRLCILVLLLSQALAAEVHTLTLRQAVGQALKQNADLVLARLDEQKAAEAVRIGRDPFSPKVIVGSGLAYSNGFPMSIEGSAPSIVQARTIMSLYNRAKSFEVAAARENLRGSAIDTNSKRDDVAFRTAVLFLDAAHAARGLDTAQRQIASLEKVAETTRLRVSEGRELPVEAKSADFSVAQARQRVASLEADLIHAESSLAVVLGFSVADRVRAAGDSETLELPPSEEASVETALTGSREIKRMESALQAKGFEAKSARAARWPQVDLVAQYALFARFNNYEDFFNRFQRNNWQFGASIQLPLFAGSANKAQAVRADLDVMRLRTEITSARDRITLDTRRSYQLLKRSQSAREVAKLDLDLTRERLTILLAQFDEGRASLRQVEELRAAETTKWLGYYDAQLGVDRAQLELLRQTGGILAALR